MAKFHNRKSVYDGYSFDSDKEVTRYIELRAMELSGDISCLKPHATFLLQEKFKHDGKVIRAIEWTPDFVYRDNAGQWIAEDVKAEPPRQRWGERKRRSVTRTEAFEIKVKLFKKRYPEYRVRIEYR